MDLMQYFKQWQQDVVNRVSNPGQTLATALQEAYPTEDNPLGGFGGIGALGKVGRTTRGMFDLNKAADATVFRNPFDRNPPNVLKNMAKENRPYDTPAFKLPNNKIYYQLEDGTFADEYGNVVFRDKQELSDVARDMRIRMEMQRAGTNKYHEDIKYGDPFGDTTR